MIVGHSHSFDRPILRTREIVRSGAVGAVKMISAQNYTDYLYRPRRPEELATESGGGAIFSQAAHQVDIVRLLGGGHVASVRALTGAWDAARPTEGAYAALLSFEGGAFASLTYSGYAHFDSDEFCGNLGEMGAPIDPHRYGAARRNLRRDSSCGNSARITADSITRRFSAGSNESLKADTGPPGQIRPSAFASSVPADFPGKGGVRGPSSHAYGAIRPIPAPDRC